MISPSNAPHNKYIDNSFIVKKNKLTLVHTNYDKKSALENAISFWTNRPLDCNYYINNIEYQNVIEKVIRYKKLGQAVSKQELKDFLSVNINFMTKVSKVFLNKHICLDNSFDVCTNDILNDWV